MSEPLHIHGADRRLIEESVPLSAIRALVQQWEEHIVVLKQLLRPEPNNSYTYARRRSELDTLERVLKQLAALCPAPPEDQP